MTDKSFLKYAFSCIAWLTLSEDDYESNGDIYTWFAADPRYGWEFIFLGANIDAVETAERFGITPDRAVDYLADSEGTKLNYTVMAQAVATFRETGTVDEACFEEISKDVKRWGGRK